MSFFSQSARGARDAPLKRESRDPEWWSHAHYVPQTDDPERLFIFAEPSHMSKQEEDAILALWNKETSAPGAEDAKGLAFDLRPSDTADQKAAAQINELRRMGERITPEVEGMIRAHYAKNCGLLESLRHFCQEQELVPVRYLNELVLMNERLIVECAKQGARAHEPIVKNQPPDLPPQRNQLEIENQALKEQNELLRQRVEELQRKENRRQRPSRPPRDGRFSNSVHPSRSNTSSSTHSSRRSHHSRTESRGAPRTTGDDDNNWVPPTLEEMMREVPEPQPDSENRLCFSDLGDHSWNPRVGGICSATRTSVRRACMCVWKVIVFVSRLIAHVSDK
ncbi:uncharacterized protein F5Z01DRAFT_752590 [Emericellopsis atlantica]|uniref:Uncharacterized protein n=1 Tax=Emericellopsis atlantica TaxID=2614577 RepID=A0A9P8CLL0_9HYPO|nr:uncharacterized protein F5Z01DRAFT_752590 [Emericellopsis atlantica]KAG9251759.1 hypothetical protein F5Z01DRAFT_752590 [Emericellopsis atlantica]